MSNIFEPHSEKQERAITSKKPVLLLGTGTQWGKTSVGGLRMMEKNFLFSDKDDNFLITSPTYKTLHQSTLPAYLKLMGDFGVYDKKFDTFKIHNGGTVYCRTSTDPDSIVGITNVRHIWGDEAGKYGLYFWENIQARADFFGCGVDLTTSPYSMNWIVKELIRPTERGTRTDVEYIRAASWENPHHSLFDPEKRRHKQNTMDPRRFNMIYGGQFGKASGLVFDCFDEVTHVINPITLPVGTRYFGGIDWGFTEPFVVVVRAITPSGHHFNVSTFYKSGLLVQQQIEAARQKMQTFGIERFFAGGDRPENIEAFCQAGLPTVAADMSRGAVRRGIDAHYELIKTGYYKLFDGSPHTVDEYASYHYPEPEDLGPDDEAKELNPVGQNDHAMSAERYVTMGTHRRLERVAPKTPDPMSARDKALRDHEARIKYRKQKRGEYPGSESFS